jgi:hypothetical protein
MNRNHRAIKISKENKGTSSSRRQKAPDEHGRVYVAPELRLPAYEVAFDRALGDLLMKIALRTHPFLAKLGKPKVVPVIYPQLIDGEVKDVTLESVPLTERIEFKTEDVLSGDVQRFVSGLEQHGSAIGRHTLRQLFRTVDKTTEATGLAIDGKKYANRVERFLAGLRAVEFQFDDNGEPNLPTIVMRPKDREETIKELEAAGPEVKRRIDEIVADKKAKWNASKSSRCLPQILQAGD